MSPSPKTRLLILNHSALKVKEPSVDTEILTFDELKAQIRNGHFFRQLFCYSDAQLYVYRLHRFSRPLLKSLLVRLLSRRKAAIVDDTGAIQSVNIPYLLTLTGRFISDFWRKIWVARQTRAEVELLLTAHRPPASLDLAGTPIYVRVDMRTDMTFGTSSGGEITHIGGVLNHLDAFVSPPVFFCNDVIPTVRPDIKTHLINVGNAFWDFPEHLAMAANSLVEHYVTTTMANRKVAFIYQRYNLNNYSGVKLAQAFNVPLIIEYNGSEIWINRHWEKRLGKESLAADIELLDLQYADVVVVVSQAMADDLITRGVEADKILVNPNGVDIKQYSPEIDGTPIRQQHHLENKLVIGYIGTFSLWHGAEVLAEAFGLLLTRYPEYRAQVRLLMMGEGRTMPQVKAALQQYNVVNESVLTGVVPQLHGPSYLAACDILASPHVPNPDGSPFFPSMTKIFEYMAMGKAIIASDLGQVSEVLKHEVTGWLVEPLNRDVLVTNLKHLIDDASLRQRLGEAARQQAVQQHTWHTHTGRIIVKLKARVER
jgi:glycosyltransferase involved in cell wall biosynthesis